MAMGVPMVLSIPKGEATDIVKTTNSGLLVKPEDPKALSESILMLYNNRASLQKLSENAAKEAQKYSRNAQAKKMLEVFHNIIAL